jgi:hypothetical protein
MFVKLDDAAVILGVPVTWVARRVRDGGLPTLPRVRGGAIRLRRGDVARLLQRSAIAA